MSASFEFERDRAYNRIVALIFGGTYDAATPLSERKLAQALDMGRMPVREALRQLEQEGVVEVRPARGTFVRSVSPEDLAEVYRVREALEGLAAELAAGRPTTGALAACGTRMRIMARDASAFTAAEIDDAGTEFHNLLMEASGSVPLSEAVRLFRMRFRLAFHLPRYFAQEIAQETLAEHIAILEAVEARDPVAARARMVDHLARGLELRLKLETGVGRKPAKGTDTSSNSGMEKTQ
ncbi:GntR family transcriptional regulator [Oceanicella sp. SM1341]|uniref:GntR family transcriptional regulator n=1 Tax=Oceanicella sp. SM1341 TaxID=1548889 RepID=UPI000E4BE2CD|nr:GntR family transcriptional regulator [Oceanicella sp. SM1341]